MTLPGRRWWDQGAAAPLDLDVWARARMGDELVTAYEFAFGCFWSFDEPDDGERLVASARASLVVWTAMRQARERPDSTADNLYRLLEITGRTRGGERG